MGCVACLGALLAQLRELPLQRPQLTDAYRNMADVLIQKRIHIATACVGCILETQQDANFLQRHVQRSTMSNEQQALDLGLLIEAEIAFCARECCQ